MVVEIDRCLSERRFGPMLAPYSTTQEEAAPAFKAAAAASSPYRKDIDGIRALAILSVVLYHAGVPLLSGGFTGVDIFFVISGYLIGGHIFSEIRQGRFSFARFYQRRAKRILPAFYLILCVTFVFSLLLLSPLELTEYSTSAIAAVFSASNIHFLRYSNYFQQSSELNPLLMTWSLAVEEQFYLLIPLLMLIAVKIRRSLLLPAILVGCAVSFLFAWRQVHVTPDKAFYLLPSRAWELGIGVALGVTELMRKRMPVPAQWVWPASACGFAAMLAPFLLLKPSVLFPGPSAIFSVLGTAVVISCPTSWINRSILSAPWLVFIGRISYSWYLWHWPLLAFLRVASGGPLPVPVRIIAVLLSFALAVVSYYLIEQPFRKSSLAPLPLITRYAGVGIALAFVLGVVWKDRGLPSRFPDLHPEQAEISSNCIVNYGIRTPDLSAHCYNPVANTSSIALWGDSHSAALSPALRSEVTARGYNFVQFSKSSCLPLAGVAKYVLSHPSVVEECIEFNQIVLKTILADASIRTVILVGRWADPFAEGNIEPLLDVDLARAHGRSPAPAMAAIFVDALSKNITALEAAGKSVVLVEDVPNFDFDPLCSMLSAQIPIRRKLASWIVHGNYTPGLAQASFLDAVGRSDDALATVHNRFHDVELIDLRPMFCDRTGLCTYMHAGRLLYSDGQHLTAAGSFYALRGVSLPGL
jgi:peptidoglycan/LPS O-acetylase OafA/YrhL